MEVARLYLCVLLTSSKASRATSRSPLIISTPIASFRFLPQAFIAVENSEPSLKKLPSSSFKKVYASPTINFGTYLRYFGGTLLEIILLKNFLISILSSSVTSDNVFLLCFSSTPNSSKTTLASC